MVKKILVTGAAGFIGSNLYNHLTKLGHEVHGVDNLRTGKLAFLGNCHIEICDFSNKKTLAWIKSGTFDVVIHLAAIPRVGYSIANPLETHEGNLTKTLELMQACVGNVERFVFASSSSVYGDAELPTHEGMQKHPKSPYSLQKSCVEDYLGLYSDLYSMDSVCLRFFSVFGPNSLGSSSYATVIAAWLTAIKSGGVAYMNGDGSQTRDFCYVDNITDAIAKAAVAGRTFRGECINVGCGMSHSLLDVKRYVKNVHYPEFETMPRDNISADVKNTQASLEKAESLLGYKPTIDLYEGIDRTVRWYEDNWEMIKTL